MKYRFLAILSTSASVLAAKPTYDEYDAAFRDWDDAKDDDKAPSSPKPPFRIDFHDWDDAKDDDKAPSNPKPPSEINFANDEQLYRCRTGGQPCNYLASCCDGFSCEWTLTSLWTKYCVADARDEMKEETFVDTTCRPYGYSCSSNTDCCDGTLCLGVGAGLLYCLALDNAATTAADSKVKLTSNGKISIRGQRLTSNNYAERVFPGCIIYGGEGCTDDSDCCDDFDEQVHCRTDSSTGLGQCLF